MYLNLSFGTRLRAKFLLLVYLSACAQDFFGGDRRGAPYAALYLRLR